VHTNGDGPRSANKIEVIVDYENVKKLLVDLAKSNNLTEEDLNCYNEDELNFDWHISFKSNLNERFQSNIANLEAAIKLCKSALAANDPLAARIGLLRASVYSHDLTSFFDALRHDLGKASADPRFHWPEIPEDYKIPSKYGFDEK
jgi:hypothetical protein